MRRIGPSCCRHRSGCLDVAGSAPPPPPPPSELDQLRRDRPRAPRRAAAAVVALAVLASLLTLTATPAAAAPPLPANTGCGATAVVAKLGVVEDRAAANMLAEALRSLVKGSDRCLLDAGLPTSNQVPAVTLREASGASQVYVVGGPAAIPDSYLTSTLDIDSYVRIAGGNRWETQSAVASAIVKLASGEPPEYHDAAAPSEPTLPPNLDCADRVVVGKLGVVEDRAAANMLAEAFRELSSSGQSRCLVDAGDWRVSRTPTDDGKRDVRQATEIYVVGGTAAIPRGWLEEQFGLGAFQRVAGPDRWQTQAAVVSLINFITTYADSSALDSVEP